MATIAALPMDTFGLRMSEGRQRASVRTYARDGVSGIGDLGFPPRPASVRGPTSRDAADLATAESIVVAYLALIDTRVTVVDQFGQTWNNVLVEDCVAGYDQMLGGFYRVTATWSLIPST